ncbi:MAG: aminoglycoside phosphotransferase family protein, partial [Bdellovibrionales bacterium]|nr:aminoglycoside phosphotransferase family protein [Bdellovibrionales bacterium]
ALVSMLEQLDTLVDNTILESNIPFTVIHGDFCASNILFDPKTRIVKLLDPRGSFGKQSIYGDPRYDLAKLMHSFCGNYDFITSDRFRLLWDQHSIEYTIWDSNYHQVVRSLFQSKLSQTYPEYLEATETIQALLFTSMIPLHADHFNRQLAMLATGIQLLAKQLVKREILHNKYIGVDV